MMHPSSYFMGIDGGGSKCKAILVDQNNTILGEGLSGPANPRFGFQQAISAIEQAASQALYQANIKQLSLGEITAGIGLAGVNLPHYYQQVLDWPHPFLTCHLTTDLHIACMGAHQGQDGAVIILGTGSCGFSIYQGNKIELGGYGFPHGDKGSGAWLGLQAISHTLNAMDGITEKTLLQDQLLTQFNVNNAIELSEAISEASSAIFASIAPLVFDCGNQGDPTAVQIIETGANYINQLAKKLIQQEQQPLAFVGGLTQGYLPWLSPFILANMRDAKASCEMGAILWARQQTQSPFTQTFKDTL
ncbi:N-acetylglucosamine kinase [uncultured Shewanella sp.]|uniref:N-acetylglucosamine kinase n=1 Tax=uncultured Shewanella sp. TaxID=173975 RepID=UPI0026252F41|nr:BadF/BadG/BcrA/BcrD ATPase family protein [uncultured Shewanella sp.]